MTPEELSTARKDLLQQLDAILHDAGFPSPDGTLGQDLPERLRRVVARAKFSELVENMGPPPVSLLAGAPRGPTGERVESLASYPDGSEQASLAEYVRNALSYLSELPVLIRKKDYSEIMHHTGHIEQEMSEMRTHIRILGDMDKIYGSNLREPVIPIKHAELEPFSMESAYRRWCPVCKTGILLVYRDQETFKLLRRDTCTTCAQRFLYTDDSIGRETFHVA